jgi:hypothetical protein
MTILKASGMLSAPSMLRRDLMQHTALRQVVLGIFGMLTIALLDFALPYTGAL